MPKALGSLKTGGRKKGTPNKRSLGFGEMLESHGIDLLAEVLGASKNLPPKDRIGIFLNLLPYQYPKRKPIDANAFDLEGYLSSRSQDELVRIKSTIESKLDPDSTCPIKAKESLDILMQRMAELGDDDDI